MRTQRFEPDYRKLFRAYGVAEARVQSLFHERLTAYPRIIFPEPTLLLAQRYTFPISCHYHT